MRVILRRIREVFDVLLLLVAIPLVGAVMAEMPVGQFLEFPPLTRYVEHAGFSWIAFIGLSLLSVIVIVPFILRVLHGGRVVKRQDVESQRFPWWGWLGLAITAITWVLAWTRFEWFGALQIFTFSPLWIGYILMVNGWTFQRSGHCMLRDRPWYTLGLFVLSAIFWWYFEYLNRFVQNWYYVGINGLSPFQYFVYATLPFATVLPAVLGTRDLLLTWPRLTAGLHDFVCVKVARPRLWALLWFLAACCGLGAVGIWPDYLYPLLWVAPLLVITSLQALRGRRTILSALHKGDWHNIVLLALAALICGFFWEMWNIKSVAKWIYEVPFVGKFRIFEMPVLGFMGYLPFGLECAVVAELMFGRDDEVVDEANEEVHTPQRVSRLLSVCVYSNKAIIALIALWFFILPGFISMKNISDPRLKDERIPKVAWSLHRDLSPRYREWARARIKSGMAADLNLYDVPGTEWPMFGSVYYLWATEALQKEWEADNSVSGEAPRVYARETIEAAVDLILDPVHHTWVRTHWGEDYMHNENVFFRSMIIAACTSYENLIGNGKHLDLLRDQVESLANELDASKFGVLEDYPDECYPIDVLAAIACIKRADKLLDTDHTAFVGRALRGFSGRMVDSRGLPPYLVDDETGEHYGPSRGIGNSYVLIFTQELWPEIAKDWYQLYEEHFWQKTWWAEGWREYPRELEPKFANYMKGRFFYDVDAGPIIAGFSPAANAFGLAAAKKNGRLDHAYTLGTQIVAALWPLPNGSLLGPQILSSRVHAPYLGEACMLFFLAQSPYDGVEVVSGGGKPWCVHLGLLYYFGTGLLLTALAWRGVKRWRHFNSKVYFPKLQFSVWAALMILAFILLLLGYSISTLLVICVAQWFPRILKVRY